MQRSERLKSADRGDERLTARYVFILRSVSHFCARESLRYRRMCSTAGHGGPMSSLHVLRSSLSLVAARARRHLRADDVVATARSWTATAQLTSQQRAAAPTVAFTRQSSRAHAMSSLRSRVIASRVRAQRYRQRGGIDAAADSLRACQLPCSPRAHRDEEGRRRYRSESSRASADFWKWDRSRRRARRERSLVIISSGCS